jgi:phosphoglycerate dehydrogenase-like enzyme
MHAGNDEAMERLIPTADVAFTSRLTPRAFAAARALRWVHSPAAGVGSMLFPAMKASPVVLSNSRGMNAAAVAEHALMLMLAALRRLPEAVRAQADRRWAADELSGLPSLRGRTLLVVGLGAIGQELARMASAFGMRVVGTRREAGVPPPCGVDEAYAPEDLPRLLPAADIVVLTAPLTAETRGMIGAAELALMKRSAWLVNVARGKLVDEPALVAALQSHRLAGAGLDVFVQEPIPFDHPFLTLDNVTLTPHIAGGKGGARQRQMSAVLENVARFARGEPCLHRIV